jgi:hypothetical protein
MTAMLVVLAGCSRTPSVGAAREAFEDKWAGKIKGGAFEVRGFKRVDGESRDVFGVKLYTLQYEVEVKHGRDVVYRGTDRLLEGLADRFDRSHSKGQIERVRGHVTFRRTEKGWRVENI